MRNTEKRDGGWSCVHLMKKEKEKDLLSEGDSTGVTQWGKKGTPARTRRLNARLGKEKKLKVQI